MDFNVDYQEQIRDKRQSQAALQRDNAILAMMGSKPSVILTDSTDLGEHIAELGDKIIGVMEAVRADKSTKEQLNMLSAEFKTLQDLARRSSKEHTDRMIGAIDQLIAAISKEKTVTVPAPRVSLTERDIDFSPLLEKLEEIVTPDAYDLSKYKAHDLNDGPDKMQYIGFLDSTGKWYILRHDPITNSDRFYFGKEPYEQAWDEKYSLDYATLGEAIDAIRS